MSQSRLESLVEQVLNVGSGYFLALAVQSVVFPLYGFHTEMSSQMQIALIFTSVSILRGYTFRRIFNHPGFRKITRLIKDKLIQQVH